MAYGAVQSLSRRGSVRGDCGWRLRVWQCHRTRNEVERVRGGGLALWGRLGSGAEYCGARQGGAMERRRPDAKGGQTASPD